MASQMSFRVEGVTSTAEGLARDAASPAQPPSATLATVRQVMQYLQRNSGEMTDRPACALLDTLRKVANHDQVTA
eukprot:8452498-Pyramimonas_sp.AAC.2